MLTICPAYLAAVWFWLALQPLHPPCCPLYAGPSFVHYGAEQACRCLSLMDVVVVVAFFDAGLPQHLPCYLFVMHLPVMVVNELKIVVG